MRFLMTAAALTLGFAPGLGAQTRWKLATADTSIELGVDGNAPAVFALQAPGVSWNWTPTAKSGVAAEDGDAGRQGAHLAVELCAP